MATRMGTNHTVQMSRKQYVVLASQYDIQTHRILLIHPPPSTHTPTHPHHSYNTAHHSTSLHITPQHSIHHLYFTANSTRIIIQQHFGGSHNHTLLRFLPSTLSLPTIMSPHTDSHHKETRMDRKREASPASWTPLDKKEVFHPNTN